MDEYKDYFIHGNKKMAIKGCVANGISESKAAELWDIMAMAASYSFNKSHAVAYSVHSIRTAWLAYYYPYEYMTAVLNSFSNDTEKLAKYLNVARNKGMKLNAPSVNRSQTIFTTDGKSIQVGISGIKGINAVAADIINERNNSGNFKNFEEFLDRMSYYKNFSKKTLESLTYAGMLDGFYGSRLNKINQLEVMSGYVKALKDYRKKIETYNSKLAQYNEAKAIQESGTDKKSSKKIKEPKAPLMPELQLVEDETEMDMLELLMKEKTYTGMYISGNPMSLFAKYIGRSADCSNVKEGPNEVICGIVQDVVRKVSKKGNTFYTFKLENNGIISGIFFSKAGEIIADGEVVKLEGEIRVNEYGVNITVRNKENLSSLRSVCEKFGDIVVKIEDVETKDEFKKLTFPKGNRTLKAYYMGKVREYKDISIDPKTAEKLIEVVGGDNISINN